MKKRGKRSEISGKIGKILGEGSKKEKEEEGKK